MAITVKQNPEKTVAVEVLAQAIVDISAGMKKNHSQPFDPMRVGRFITRFIQGGSW